jgi:hypothetical protein
VEWHSVSVAHQHERELMFTMPVGEAVFFDVSLDTVRAKAQSPSFQRTVGRRAEDKMKAAAIAGSREGPHRSFGFDERQEKRQCGVLVDERGWIDAETFRDPL